MLAGLAVLRDTRLETTGGGVDDEHGTVRLQQGDMVVSQQNSKSTAVSTVTATLESGTMLEQAVIPENMGWDHATPSVCTRLNDRRRVRRLLIRNFRTHLRSTRDHVLDEVTVARRINDRAVVLGRLELPQRDIDGDAALALRLQLVQHCGATRGKSNTIERGWGSGSAFEHLSMAIARKRCEEIYQRCIH